MRWRQRPTSSATPRSVTRAQPERSRAVRLPERVRGLGLGLGLGLGVGARARVRIRVGVGVSERSGYLRGLES